MTAAGHHLPLDGLMAYWFGLCVVVACVPSLPDISVDPTLLTGAAVPGLLPCGVVLRDDAAVFCRHKPGYIRGCADLVDDATFMATLALKRGFRRQVSPEGVRERFG